MTTAAEERKSKLMFDMAGSSIKRTRHPFRLVIRTKYGREHIIVFGGNLEAAVASRKRFVDEFYATKKALVARIKSRPRLKVRTEMARFLSDEDFS